jgi:hypothetical protein
MPTATTSINFHGESVAAIYRGAAGPEPGSTALIHIKDLCDQVRENLLCFIVIVTEQLRRLCS